MTLWDHIAARKRGAMASALARRAHYWTEEQQKLLLELRRDEAMEWPEIARVLGVSAAKCESKYNNLIYKHRTSEGSNRPHGPSNAALLNRDLRDRARDAQSLTGIAFGDPPPGYSALDRRGGA